MTLKKVGQIEAEMQTADLPENVEFDHKGMITSHSMVSNADIENMQFIADTCRELVALWNTEGLSMKALPAHGKLDALIKEIEKAVEPV